MKKNLMKDIKNYDIVHLNNFRSYQNIIASKFSVIKDVPYVLQPRGDIPRLNKKIQKRFFDFLFGNKIVRNADTIIASSKIESDQYKEVFSDIGGKNLIHIPNGINPKTYHRLPEKGLFKKEYSIKKNDKLILFLSRVHERKGADLLINAFNKLRNEFDDLKLVIAGPDEGHLNKLVSIVNKLKIENEVIFPGPLYGNNKIEAYVDADVFVLPAKDRYESFGNVALEAATCGVPMVVTNVCGISEWFDNDAISIAKPGEESLSQCISKILKNKDLKIKMIKSAKKTGLRLSWSEVAKRTEEVYLKILNK